MARSTRRLGPRLARADLALRHRSHFFVVMSIGVLLIVLVGFGPTLYLRLLFDVPPISAYAHVHGVLLTTWFALVVAQAVLIRRRSVRMHRRLGAAGVALGMAVVTSSIVVTAQFVERVMHAPTELDRRLSAMMGSGVDPPLTDLAATSLWGNLTSLALFATLLTLAVLMRDRSDAHKRLMMLASLSILAPAIARIARWPGLGGDLGPLVPIVMVSLLSAMIWFDFRIQRRVHWATLAGGAFVLVGIIASTIIARSDLGLAVVRSLDSSQW